MLTSELKAQTLSEETKVFHVKQKQENEPAVFMLHKIDFKTKLITKDKDIFNDKGTNTKRSYYTH